MGVVAAGWARLGAGRVGVPSREPFTPTCCAPPDPAPPRRSGWTPPAAGWRSAALIFWLVAPLAFLRGPLNPIPSRLRLADPVMHPIHHDQDQRTVRLVRRDIFFASLPLTLGYFPCCGPSDAARCMAAAEALGQKIFEYSTLPFSQDKKSPSIP